MTLLDRIQMPITSKNLVASNNYYGRGPLYSMATIVVVGMDEDDR